MGRGRSGYFKQLAELEIGDVLVVDPEPGEHLDHALRRLKLRLSKWKAEGLSYRAMIEGEGVKIQRLPPGRHGKYADWWLLNVGEALLLKRDPAPGDRKRGKAAEDFINHLRYEYANKDRSEAERVRAGGYWVVGYHSSGALVALRVIGANDLLSSITHPHYAETVKVGWGGEWLT